MAANQKAVRAAAKEAADVAENGAGVVDRAIDETVEHASNLSGRSLDLGLAFGALAVSLTTAAYSLAKFRQQFNGGGE